MHEILLNTYREIIGVFEMHTAFIPEDILLDNNVIDTIIEERRPVSHAIQVCFLLYIEKRYLANKII